MVLHKLVAYHIVALKYNAYGCQPSHLCSLKRTINKKTVDCV